MNKIIIATIIFITNFFLCYSQSNEEKSLKEFLSGQTIKYSTNGEGKSKGLKVHIKYPNSWISEEGDRPHIVRKFSQQDYLVTALIYVQKTDREFSRSDIDELMTVEGLKSTIPKSAKLMSCNPNLKIENLKAGSVEYVMESQIADIKIYQHTITYTIIYKSYILQFSCAAMDKTGNDVQTINKVAVDKKYAIIYPLFKQMFSSIVIDNIWE